MATGLLRPVLRSFSLGPSDFYDVAFAPSRCFFGGGRPASAKAELPASGRALALPAGVGGSRVVRVRPGRVGI